MRPAQATTSPQTFTKSEAGRTATAFCFSPAGAGAPTTALNGRFTHVLIRLCAGKTDVFGYEPLSRAP